MSKTIFQGHFSVVPRKVEFRMSFPIVHRGHDPRRVSKVFKDIDMFSYIILFVLKNCSPRSIVLVGHVCKPFYNHVSLLNQSIFCPKVDNETVDLINGIHSTRRMIRLRYDFQNRIDYGFDGEFYTSSKNQIINSGTNKKNTINSKFNNLNALQLPLQLGNETPFLLQMEGLGTIGECPISEQDVNYKKQHKMPNNILGIQFDQLMQRYGKHEQQLIGIHGGMIDWYIGCNYDSIPPIKMGILDINNPPRTQPSIFCGYSFDIKDQSIKIGETMLKDNHWCYCEWIVYLINNIFYPNGYIVNGCIPFCGAMPWDIGSMNIKNNRLRITRIFKRSDVLTFKKILDKHGRDYLINYLSTICAGYDVFKPVVSQLGQLATCEKDPDITTQHCTQCGIQDWVIELISKKKIKHVIWKDLRLYNYYNSKNIKVKRGINFDNWKEFGGFAPFGICGMFSMLQIDENSTRKKRKNKSGYSTFSIFNQWCKSRYYILNNINNFEWIKYNQKESFLTNSKQFQRMFKLRNKKFCVEQRRRDWKRCNWKGCIYHEMRRIDKALKMCSRCRKVFYCSRFCQKQDWNVGNHTIDCRRH